MILTNHNTLLLLLLLSCAAQAQAPVSSWQVHYTGEGRPYYHNPVTGSTQWEAPLGFA